MYSCVVFDCKRKTGQAKQARQANNAMCAVCTTDGETTNNTSVSSLSLSDSIAPWTEPVYVSFLRTTIINSLSLCVCVVYRGPYSTTCVDGHVVFFLPSQSPSSSFFFIFYYSAYPPLVVGLVFCFCSSARIWYARARLVCDWSATQQRKFSVCVPQFRPCMDARFWTCV